MSAHGDPLAEAQEEIRRLWRLATALRDEAHRRGDIIRALTAGAWIHDTVGDWKDASTKALELIGVDVRTVEDGQELAAIGEPDLYSVGPCVDVDALFEVHHDDHP